MVKPIQRAEIKTFTGGLVTNAPKLEDLADSSQSEVNFNCELDGSRKRRLGFGWKSTDLEHAQSTLWSQQAFEANGYYLWKNPGGASAIQFVVTAVGKKLRVFNASADNIGNNLRFSIDLPDVQTTTSWGFASVNGTLVIVGGRRYFHTLEYASATDTFTFTPTQRYFIRDLFGVYETIIPTYESDVTFRGGINTFHNYNLRNQGWALGRLPWAYGDQPLGDPVIFAFSASSVYPSNADTVWQGMDFRPIGKEIQDGGTPNASSTYLSAEAFNPKLWQGTAPGSSHSAKGFFIIDAFARGDGRRTAYNNFYANHPELTPLAGTDISLLTGDLTVGGPTCVVEHAGRAFFSGVLDSQLLNGDSRSPDYANYVFYSQLVKGREDIGKLYQEGDPTSRESSDIVDTDGGFIKVAGAVGIRKLVPLDDKLLVFATNGVWAITGAEGGFKATNFNVTKVSNFGCISADSIIVNGRQVFYWGLSAIYTIAPNQFGDLEVGDLTTGRLETYYMAIHEANKGRCVAGISQSRNRVHWVFNNEPISSILNTKSTDLVYDIKRNAFYPQEHAYAAEFTPRIIGIYETQGQGVTGSGTIVINGPYSPANRMVYVGVRKNNLNTNIFFAYYLDPDFRDWKPLITAGLDTPAHILTAYTSGGDIAVKKQISYLVTVLRNTERSITGDVVDRESSLLGRVQWDYTTLVRSNRWSSQMQLYRKQRIYVSNSSDIYNGQDVQINKTKLRGHGKAFSLRLDTEPSKDCHIYGWNLTLTGNGVT